MPDDAPKTHMPIRMCVVCRKRFPKNTLLRFVTREGAEKPLADPRQVFAGRGCYLCHAPSCQERFAKKSAQKRKGV